MHRLALSIVLSICIVGISNAQEARPPQALFKAAPAQLAPTAPTAQTAPAPQTVSTSTSAQSSDTAPVLPKESYIVQLSEYHVGDPSMYLKTTAEIVAILTESKDKTAPRPVETIRLATVSGVEGSVQFGKNVGVTTGTVAGPNRQVARQTHYMPVGTILRATVTPVSDKLIVKLTYEASRLENIEGEDGAANTTTTNINTTQLVEVGKPTLISGAMTGESPYMLLTVTK